MKIKVSDKLQTLYKTQNKTPNYALKFLLNSIEPDCCSECIGLIEEFQLLGAKTEIEVNDSNIQQIKELFGKADSNTVEQLLWVALLFPEI